jgi:hypothetical protein
MAFYERGFSVPSYRFLYWLLQPILWLGATPSDPLWDLAYHGLCDPVRGLHGD